MFNNQVLLICLFAGMAVFVFFLFFAALRYSKNTNKYRFDNKQADDWLFHDFYLKLYGALFGNKNEDEMAVKFRIEIEKYYNSCKITGTIPNVKKLIINHVYGIVAIIVGFILGALLFNISLIFAGVFLFAGLILGLMFVYLDQKTLDSKAKAMRLQVANELPRFLDLLKPELQIGMTPENAIYTICDRCDMLLTKELKVALQEAKLDMGGWTKALEKIATKYNVETLNDFVMDVSTSFKKGVPITHIIERKIKEIKKTHLLNIKERAAKTTNTILLPVAVFQFVPLMVFILFPVIISLFSSML